MSRRPLIAGNWKMNKNIGEAVVLAQDISNNLCKDWTDHVDVVVCPPFLDIKPVKTVFEFDKQSVAVGAQDVYWEESGAYTGEVSAAMLAEAGCEWCIVGHSERRSLFSETNEDVNRKIKALVAAGLKPIVCMGESLGVREADATLDYVCAQLRAAFAGLRVSKPDQFVVAYEPIWAIGTGRTATPEQAQEVCQVIRATLADIFSDEIASGTRILYGGSMNPGNVEALLAKDDIDGGLIGGASLKSDSFIQLIQAGL